MYWEASAPSNLALIKYAGKKDKSNLPLNASLSYTLDHFLTKVRITEITDSKDHWAPLKESVFEKRGEETKDSKALLCDNGKWVKKDLEKEVIGKEKQEQLHGMATGELFYLKRQESNCPPMGETLSSESGKKPSEKSNQVNIQLSSSSVERFLKFFQFLKGFFQVSGYYLVQSANNFPASIGAASSASSFCALTQATYQMALSCSSYSDQVESLTPSCLSVLSRRGSGSSCRSFFRPWAFWGQEEEGSCSIELPFPGLIHQLFVVDSKQKVVSSSLAHEKIVTTPAFKGRVHRAQNRLSALLSALKRQDWKQCFEITWEEFQDLHQLYEDAGIFYRNEKSHKILNIVKLFWEKEKDGPLVTMDAGSSVHLLYRLDQKKAAAHLSSLVKDGVGTV